MAIESLSVANFAQIYYYIAMFATIVFLIKLIMFAFTGGDMDAQVEVQTEIHADSSFNFLSIQSVLAFLMGFGWMGYAAIKQFSLTQYVSLAAAFGVGLFFMLVNTFLMFSVRKLEKNVKKDASTAIGKIGKAYSTLQPRSMGQVEVEVSGQLSVVNAMNDSDEVINSFDAIKVVKVVGDLLYVVKNN